MPELVVNLSLTFSLYIWDLFYDLYVAVCFIQHWLSVNIKSKNVVVAQSHRLDVTADLLVILESLRTRFQSQCRNACTREAKVCRQGAKLSLFYVLIKTSTRKDGSQ